MKVTVVPSVRFPETFSVKVEHGVQSFRLDYNTDRDGAEWYALMFRKMLTKWRKEWQNKHKN